MIDNLINEATTSNTVSLRPPTGELDEATVAAAERAIAGYRKSQSLRERVLTKLGARAVDTIFIRAHNRLQEEKQHRENLALEAAVEDAIRAAEQTQVVAARPKLQVIQGGLTKSRGENGSGINS